MGKRFSEEETHSRNESVWPRRRRIKVIAGADLAEVEQSVKDWLTAGHWVTHLQIDHLPNQPYCQQWQAIMTYYPNPGANRPPRRICRRCKEQAGCQKYQGYLERQQDGFEFE